MLDGQSKAILQNYIVKITTVDVIITTIWFLTLLFMRSKLITKQEMERGKYE